MAAFESQVAWPKRAVVTAGMPYGNKPLHVGHIGGVFVPADMYARFLRDRIGAENVRFVCGTDCYGSPINEGYRKLVEAGKFCGSIADYVKQNHDIQAHTLDSYGISLDIFEGSGLGESAGVHQDFSNDVIETLYENGWLELDEKMQFYDPVHETFLNGSQVEGRCPFQGCKSSKAYADECELGHQYFPEDLIAPKSTLSGETPEMRPVRNWYFDLLEFSDFLKALCKELECDEDVREIVPSVMKEFLGPAIIYVKCEFQAEYDQIKDELPEHIYHECPKGKQSFELEFRSVKERDLAREMLSAKNIRYRAGKALVPFRLTGNIEWGVKVPKIEDVDGLTFWCWPESLWAPISFTISANAKRGENPVSWRDFWCSEDSGVYQFIGQDNIYFYGIVQPALWEGIAKRGELCKSHTGLHKYLDGQCDINQSNLVANHHLLFGKKKASSSGDIKPPSADELLEFYTVEQLRTHFVNLGLDKRSVAFCPKAFEPDEKIKNDPRVADPVLKEGTLLTNIFNRLARSCFYEAANNFDACMPLSEPSAEVVEESHKALAKFEDLMKKTNLHQAFTAADEYLRFANKHWADNIKKANDMEDEGLRRQVLCDAFYCLRVACVLMHSSAPFGCEKICEYLQLDPECFFSWNHEFLNNAEVVPSDFTGDAYPIKTLPPRFDFFRKHESQYK